MTKHDTIPAPPSASDILQRLVDAHVEQDPDNPFLDRKSYAKQYLVLQLIQEAYDPNQFMHQFALKYEQVDRLLFPQDWTEHKADTAEAYLDDLRRIFADIEQDFMNQIESFSR